MVRMSTVELGIKGLFLERPKACSFPLLSHPLRLPPGQTIPGKCHSVTESLLYLGSSLLQYNV